MEVKSSEGRNEEGEVRKKRKRDIDVEAASTEVVASHGEGRNEEGGSKKRRKRVKDGSSVDSVTGTGGNTVGREADSLNEMETEKSDSSNGRKKKKKRSSVREPPPLQEATYEKLGDVGVLLRGDEGDARRGRLEKSVEDATETDNVEHSNDRKKDKKKKKKKKHSIDGDPVLQEAPVGDNQDSGKDIRHARDSIDETKTGNSEDPNDRKKEKKKRKHRIEQEPVSQEATLGDGEANTKEVDKSTSENSASTSEDRKKEKEKKKKKQRVDQETVSREASVGNNEANTKDNDKATTQNSEEKKKKKKKTNQTIDQDQPARTKSMKSLGNRIDKDASDGSPPKSTSKRVSFSENLQVFPISNDDDETSGEDKDLVRGKRFSPEEDEMVKAAVLEYIDSHALGDEGLNMIMHCKDHKEVKNCWKEIGLALPWRPNRSVYSRAHILFERDGNRKWTPEECELVMKYYEKHGADWKTLGEAMGKHRVHVKDTFRRLKVKNPKFGKWSQDEYQTLFDLVNADLRMKVFEERKSKHGMLKDNISWEAISDKLETRSNGVCCNKWYMQLTSPMVQAKEWLDEDDYLLVMELYNSNACCMEDVDWDNLLEHRAGELCRKRWNQMVRHLGDTSNKSFAELVEILTQRYCFDVLEARQVYRSKPLVD